jgi:enterochelin esterase-like enzyme
MKNSLAMLLMAALPLCVLSADSTAQIATNGAVPRIDTAPAQSGSTAQAGAIGARGGRGGGFGGAVQLGPDDKPAFDDPPAGFNIKRDNIPHGELKVVPYDSRTLGTRRQIRVYLPPGYSAERKYPTLYLLHGMGWNDLEWTQQRHADVVIDNLVADGKIQPMIVVFPNGDSSMTAAAIEAAGGNAWMGGGMGRGGPGAGAGSRGTGARGGAGGMDVWLTPFENDLIKDIIPCVEAHYSVYSDANHRALAGLSMGGGQALNIGLAHPETFAFVGGFSAAPDTKAPADLVPDPAVPKKLKLLWLACGNKDGLIRISQGVHSDLKEKGVPHVWHVDGNAHDTPEWENNLYLFSQRIFK